MLQEAQGWRLAIDEANGSDAQLPERRWCPINVRSNLAKSFVAVISGNAIYFILLLPLLPPAARHKPYHVDLGLLVDFWVCLACYGIVELISRRMRARHDH